MEGGREGWREGGREGGQTYRDHAIGDQVCLSLFLHDRRQAPPALGVSEGHLGREGGREGGRVRDYCQHRLSE